jgi:XTP/dITP diphosphohydrolase
MIRVKVITSNPGKLREFQSELSSLGIELEHLKVEYKEIQTDRLENVVRHGLEELKNRGLDNFIIDDSGLFIYSLGGFPGVYSAYALKTLGCKGILRLIEGEKDRSAHFECCIGSSISGLGDIITCAKAHGNITHRERGDSGFGFDPIFQPNEDKRTYAEIPLDEKNLISHRGRAIRSFYRLLEERMERS